MAPEADDEGPVRNVEDQSYNELADIFILVMGTCLVGVCVVQLEDGLDQELYNNGEGRVEAWPVPMQDLSAYQEAYDRLSEIWFGLIENQQGPLVML